ncbi:MAG TPA: 2-C-methyl-D-erythritol 2,4-cyclodiphosphate synthase, partial [Thermoleophilaceae bacterium]|nr:2-C-methyl-D-erythritol 2,4-cyclodiphosphate synthase [Thermoleophilaceae bacterium]
LDLLRAVAGQLADAGYSPANIDATVACEEPKLGPHRDEMRTRLAEAAGLEPSAVNVKFTTGEKMGFVGRGEGIAALAIATVRQQDR